MESLAASVAKTCTKGLLRMKNGQTPHPKIFYCHDNSMTVPSNLIISCRICGKSVDSPPNRIYINFFGTGGNPDVIENSSSSSESEDDAMTSSDE